VQISHATQAAPGRVNEDFAAAGPDWMMVLDGATAPADVTSGCGHDVRWLVRRLAAALGRRLTLADPAPLGTLLAGAIAETRDAHGDGCDLDNPDSPSATVSVVRALHGRLDYLVLCDSPLLLRNPDGRLTLIADDRLARLRGSGPLTHGVLRERRNRPGGFWVASTDPGAADHAVHGSASLDSVTDAALLTDGVTRLAEWYGYSWPDIVTRLRESGPAALIGLVRAAEREHAPAGAKRHDDATAAHMRLQPP
jgi:Protein phosphatase 2C